MSLSNRKHGRTCPLPRTLRGRPSQWLPLALASATRNFPSCFAMTILSPRSMGAGGDRRSRPTSCLFRRCPCIAARRFRKRRRSVTSPSPTRRWCVRHRKAARPHRPTFPIWSCTAFCTSRGTTTRRMKKPKRWNVWSATSWPDSASPIPTRCAMQTSDLLAMADPNEPPVPPHYSPLARDGGEEAARCGHRHFSGLARRSNGLSRDPRESWLNRVMRALFGWSPTSIRSDLKILLEGAQPTETGFSPDESRMLKNILGLRERRLDDLMVPRADIVAVQQDIPLGELFKVFENAPHSRLVVYNDTLDEPVGMVHIRDLIAFMTAGTTVPPEGGAP